MSTTPTCQGRISGPSGTYAAPAFHRHLPPATFGVGGGRSQNVGGKRRGSQVSIPSDNDTAGKSRREATVEEVEDIDAPKPHGKVVPGGKIMVEEETLMEGDTATEGDTDEEAA